MISPTQLHPPHHHSSPMIEETKFNIYGTMFHQNGYSRSDCLSFIAATKEEALATCKRLYPLFEVISIWEDESEVEVVKLQSLI